MINHLLAGAEMHGSVRWILAGVFLGGFFFFFSFSFLKKA